MIKQAAHLAFALAVLLPLQTFAGGAPSLVVWATDGSKASYALTENPKLTFTATSFIVTFHGEEKSFPLTDVARITYENVLGTGINELWCNESPFTVSGNFLLFSTLQTGSKVTVYTVDGRLIHQEFITAEGCYAFPLSDITAGVYMVSVNGVTYKFLKR